MRGRQIAQEVEPENGKLVQHRALLGDAGGENVVEGGDAVGGDNQQPPSMRYNVAHFAARVEFNARQIGFERTGFVELTLPSGFNRGSDSLMITRLRRFANRIFARFGPEYTILMQADRACPQAISLSVGALISLVFFCAVLAGIAYLMPHFLSISQFSSSLLAPAIAILGRRPAVSSSGIGNAKRHAVPR